MSIDNYLMSKTGSLSLQRPMAGGKGPVLEGELSVEEALADRRSLVTSRECLSALIRNCGAAPKEDGATGASLWEGLSSGRLRE
jgi:hypothetical protein